jgi:LysR family glycine cleavage system transcriptional activator
MLRRLPPISTLNALVAVARHQSFTKAAMALNVTQSAVSHQIKLIEDLWGVKLFERRGHGIVATDAGRRLAELTGEFFDRIGHTLDELRVVSSHEKLRIDTLQSFAVKWLVPRLRRFDELYPNIDVWISTHEQLVDFAANSIDIAIRLGDGRFGPYHATLLLQEEVFPVCTPELLERMGRPQSPRELLRYPLLLRLGEPNHMNWADWFEAVGVPGVKLTEGTRFPDTNMALEAAMDGLGIALARTAHVVEELAAGYLVRLFDLPVPSDVAWYLVCPPGHEERPIISAFRRWILDEVASMGKRPEAVRASA